MKYLRSLAIIMYLPRPALTTRGYLGRQVGSKYQYPSICQNRWAYN